MIRKLMNSIVDNTRQPLDAISPSSIIKTAETATFEWLKTIDIITSMLRTVSPCFPVTAKNVTVLTEPQQFYENLLKGCETAQKRITLVSLYLGTSKLDRALIEAVQSNASFRDKRLKINVLLDYSRASRFQGGSSRTMLLPLLQNNNDVNCRISLYHTPALRGLLKKFLPQRWNELLGLQHMKLYIFDDTLIISGANLSKDYYTNRQDRYFVIRDKDLSDFYCGLTESVQKFSFTMDGNNDLKLHDEWKWSPYEGSKQDFVEKARKVIEDYFENAKRDWNLYKKEGCDTWIFPSIQMNQLGIVQDTVITDRIIAECAAGGRLKISTGYFNLTSQYCKTLLEDCQGSCDILMAHPNANGFLGAKGVAGGIPYAYSLIAREFKNNIVNKCKDNKIKLYEYLRDGWTYHGKGLWYYPPSNDLPCLTTIGSPNFGERSAQKDLETQIVLVTENEELKKRLHFECSRLFERGLPAEVERKVPHWVRAIVVFCRNYF